MKPTRRALLVLFGTVSLAILMGVPSFGSPQIRQMTMLSEDIPAGLDPDGASLGLPPTQTGIVNLLDSLIEPAPGRTNAEGVKLLDFRKYEGRLAESWEFDKQSLTWTFHLRRDVVGCSGNTFTADDVIYSYGRAKSASGKIPLGWFEGSTAGIEGFTTEVLKKPTPLGNEVRKIDDYTVQFKQSAPPSQLFLPVFAQWAGTGIFDSKVMKAHATQTDPWSHGYSDTVNLPGFGPYCLEKWVKGSEFIVRANPRYYRGKPAIDRIVYRKVPVSANRVAAVRTGAAQLVEHLTPKQYSSLKSARNVKVAGVFGNEVVFVHMNWKSPPFENVKLRKAIAYAVPYDRIISTVYVNQARKWHGVMPSTYPGYHLPTTQYRTDRARAKQLLADAGYPGGKGLEKFAKAFVLTYSSEFEDTLGVMATIIRAALREIGIPVTLNPVPQTQFSTQMYSKMDVPFALENTWKAVPVDGGYTLLISATTYGCCTNYNHFVNAEIDGIVKKANVEPNPVARNQMLARAQNIMADLVNFVPIVEFKTQWAYTTSLKGITWHPNNSVKWFDLRIE